MGKRGIAEEAGGLQALAAGGTTKNSVSLAVWRSFPRQEELGFVMFPFGKSRNDRGGTGARYQSTSQQVKDQGTFRD